MSKGLLFCLPLVLRYFKHSSWCCGMDTTQAQQEHSSDGAALPVGNQFLLLRTELSHPGLLGTTKALSQTCAEQRGKERSHIHGSWPHKGLALPPVHTSTAPAVAPQPLPPRNSACGSSASRCSGWDWPLETEGIPYPSYPPPWHAASRGCTPGKGSQARAALAH